MKLRVKSTLICATWIILLTTCIGYADLTDGLIAYYPFDGNANDMSGNGNNATPYNDYKFCNHSQFLTD
ncbi:MAG: hypothetical protein JXM79_13065 [Sedimentisphaerales bacterium]|nr:hypothetical protein [Sedimentisphaerales bacterium]